VPAALFVAALWRLNSSVTAWDRAIDKDLLPYLLDRSKNASQRTPLLLLLAVWVLSSLALAGPVWEKLPQPVQKREDALVIVLDLSLSMFAPDHSPSRVDLAKRKLRDILALRGEGQTALVVYAGDAHTVTPLTDDVVTIEALVPSLNPNIMPLFGSDPVSALEIAIDLLKNTDGGSGKILLMTDGIAGYDEEQTIADLLDRSGNELLVMGIGTEEGAPIRTNDGNFLTDERGTIIVPKLNKNLLSSLANRVGGRYHDIQLADSDLAYLLSDLNPLDDEALSDVEEEFDVWYEAGPWLLLLVLPLAAFAFRRGWLLVLPLLVATSVLTPVQPLMAAEFGPTVDIQINEDGFPLPSEAEAGFSWSETWRNLWQTPDQRGAEAMGESQYGEAARLFESPDWRGAASYRGGNYEAAIASFAANPTADGHYNRGNALALSGNYAEAIIAYNIALGLGDTHAEALQNKEIVEQLLQEQEAEEGEQDEGDNEDSDSQQNSESESDQQEENSEQQDQESQEGDQEQQEQDQQQQDAPEEQESSESNSEQNTASETENQEFEEQQALEQWLRRIDDDPGELLRRKFRYQYRKRQLEGTANQNGGQIW
jgi:Ca-activated chloride channel family protein